MEIDPGRLQRAVWLDVRKLDAETWEVTGGTAPHTVSRMVGCDCLDAAYNPDAECKHILAIRLARAGPDVLAGLRELVGT